VLQAAAIGQSGQVLVLDMGEPVRIVDLARQLIRLAGHTEDEIGIEFSGLRPGEKLYEELLADADTTLPTVIPQLRIAKLGVSLGDAGNLLGWAQSRSIADDTEVRERLSPCTSRLAGSTSPTGRQRSRAYRCCQSMLTQGPSCWRSFVTVGGFKSQAQHAGQ
jgi:hypothetical protein